MTTEQAVRDATARWMRRRRRLIGYGQWKPFVDAEPVRQHVLAIRDAGMSLKNLTAVTGVSSSTLDHLIYGGTGYPPAVRIRTESATTLLAYWPTLDDYVDGAVIDATGTRRRLQALSATGWPATSIHQRIDFVNVKTIENARYNQQVTARLARAVRDLYERACGSKAESHGITPGLATRCRNHAARSGWLGPEVWDDDTIDDPTASPEFTGCCGTDRGYWTHKLQKLPMCPPCAAAHQQWIDDQVDVDPAVRNQRMFAARAAAGTRGVDIAHDARELMRLGCDYEQAAARLGITRQHLQQELKRHPEKAAA
ncbi:hypothetical protein [Streptomyces sp. ok210]|uniref:hypothetical protein n=1 Tax=Streptomyces sp. ok210 TaxID=1761905 RepID=UPI0008F1C653|nr:hypothetical protein [Streptomyces sp. ok210]SFT31861.1 hypothetical protein SAMN04487982_12477 [Streptomyces sp. ok210]